MGQYFIVVNRTRAEFFTLIPLGYKFWTMISKSETLIALGLLLRQSDEYNASGDIAGERKEFPFKPDDEWVGRWAGDEITIVGDYDTSLLYQWTNVEYRDVSIQVQKMLNVFVASERLC